MPSEGPMDKMGRPLRPLAPGRRRGEKAAADENYNIMVRLKPGVLGCKRRKADIEVIASRIREKDKTRRQLRHCTWWGCREQGRRGRTPGASGAAGGRLGLVLLIGVRQTWPTCCSLPPAAGARERSWRSETALGGRLATAGATTAYRESVLPGTVWRGRPAFWWLN